MLPAQSRTFAEIAWLEMVVGWANGQLGAEEMDGFGRAFGSVLAEYDVVNPITDHPMQIGERQVSRRTCRFCHRTRAQGATFTSDAHAISRGLGNVRLKLADEYDSCNGFSGRISSRICCRFSPSSASHWASKGGADCPRPRSVAAKLSTTASVL